MDTMKSFVRQAQAAGNAGLEALLFDTGNMQPTLPPAMSPYEYAARNSKLQSNERSNSVSKAVSAGPSSPALGGRQGSTSVAGTGSSSSAFLGMRLGTSVGFLPLPGQAPADLVRRESVGPARREGMLEGPSSRSDSVARPEERGPGKPTRSMRPQPSSARMVVPVLDDRIDVYDGETGVGDQHLAGLASKLSKRCTLLERRYLLLRTAFAASVSRLDEVSEVAERLSGVPLTSFLVCEGGNDEDGEGVHDESSSGRSTRAVMDLVRTELSGQGILASGARTVAVGLGLQDDSDSINGSTPPPYLGFRIDVDRLHRSAIAKTVQSYLSGIYADTENATIGRDTPQSSSLAAASMSQALANLPSLVRLEEEVSRLAGLNASQTAQLSRLTANLTAARKDGHVEKAAKVAAEDTAQRAQATLAVAQEQIAQLQHEMSDHAAEAQGRRAEAEMARAEAAGVRLELAAVRARAGETAMTVAALSTRNAELQRSLAESKVASQSGSDPGAGSDTTATSLADVQLFALRAQHGQLEKRHRELAAGHANLQQVHSSLLEMHRATGSREPGTVTRRGTDHPSEMASPPHALPIEAEPEDKERQPEAVDNRLADLKCEFEDVCTQLALARQQEGVLKGEVRTLNARLDAVSSMTMGAMSPGGVPINFAYLRHVVLQFALFAGRPECSSQARATALVLATLLDWEDKDRKKLGLPAASAVGGGTLKSPAGRGKVVGSPSNSPTGLVPPSPLMAQSPDTTRPMYHAQQALSAVAFSPPAKLQADKRGANLQSGWAGVV